MKLKSLVLQFSMIGLLLSSAITHAQGTLQFNAVKLITGADVVPTGKVWKVISVLGPATTTSSNLISTVVTSPTLPGNHTILVEGLSIDVAAQLAMGSNFYGYGGTSTSRGIAWFSKETCTALPFWLPEGKTLAPSINVNFISVIEFNVVP